MIAIANKKNGALGVICLFDISVHFVSYHIVNVIITDRVETSAPIPFKLTFGNYSLEYTVYLFSIQYKNHICQEIRTFMQWFLLIHDCEEAIEIKNKGIKQWLHSKVWAPSRDKEKIYASIDMKRKYLWCEFSIKLLAIWLGWNMTTL